MSQTPGFDPSPSRSLRIPNWLFLGAVFVLGGATALIGSRIIASSEPSVTRKALASPNDALTLKKIRTMLEHDEAQTDRLEAVAAGGHPLLMPRLELSDSQRKRIQMVIAMAGASSRSLFPTQGIPELAQMSSRELRSIACVLNPAQRHRWIVAISPAPLVWANANPEMAEQAVHDDIEIGGSPDVLIPVVKLARSSPGSERLAIFASEPAL